MLRTFGAEKVSILAGGLAGWQRDEWLLREGEEAHEGGEFEAKFTPQAVVRLTDVLLASHEKPRKSLTRVRRRVLTLRLMNHVRD